MYAAQKFFNDIHQQQDEKSYLLYPILDKKNKKIFFPSTIENIFYKKKFFCGIITWNKNSKINIINNLIYDISIIAHKIIYNNYIFDDNIKNNIIDIINNYKNYLLNNNTNNSKNKKIDYLNIKKAADEGWISEGKYYNFINQLLSKTSYKTINKKSIINIKQYPPNDIKGINRLCITKKNIYSIHLLNILKEIDILFTKIKKEKFSLDENIKNDIFLYHWKNDYNKYNIFKKIINNIFTLGLFHLSQNWLTILKKNDNPINKLHDLGKISIKTAIDIWSITAGIVISSAASLIGIPIISHPEIFFLILSILIVPVIIALTVPLFAAGGILMIYIPFIPYIAFLFGILNWFLFIIESIIITPILILGILYPEGHYLFGKSENILYMISNIFLRPALMSISFLFAILINNVFLHFVNSSFLQIAKDYNILNGYLGVFGWIIIIIIYTSLILSLIKQIFIIIDEIPNRIFLWININIKSFTNYFNSDQSIQGVSNIASQEQGRAAYTSLQHSVRLGSSFNNTNNKEK